MPLRIARFLVLFKFWWLYYIIAIKLHYKLWHSHDRMQRYTKYGYIRLRPIACNEFSKYNKIVVFITKLIIICYSLLKAILLIFFVAQDVANFGDCFAQCIWRCQFWWMFSCWRCCQFCWLLMFRVLLILVIN